MFCASGFAAKSAVSFPPVALTLGIAIIRKEFFNVINANATHENDTGSPEVQVAIWTERIRELTEHLKAHPNDDHSRLGMYQLVGKRRRMLDYLAKKDIERYRAIIAKLNIRK